jgi:predicted phage tail protein
MPAAVIVAAVAMGAAGAAAAGIITATVAMVITVAATVAASLLIKPAIPSIGAYTSQQERKQTLRSATAPMNFIYGATVVSGLLFFAEEQSTGDDIKEWVHLGIAIAGHPIDRVGRIWLGDELLGEYGDLARYEIHNNRSTVDPFMKANCRSWKDDMIGKGITWARISLKFDGDKFPAGLPNVKFEIFGKKVYDPRNGTTAWSDNAALCILDFYRSYLKVPDSDINMEQFIQAANICDQTLNDGGGVRKRYTLNGTFDASETQAGILDDMHLACAGEPTFMAGKHGILAGAYYGPATMEIRPGQIISSVKIVPEAAYNDKLNIVTGTFLDAKQQYSEVDYPAVKVQKYIDEDGGEYTSDLKLRFVANEFQAQQLAQIKMNRTRIGRTITFTMNMSGYQYRPGYYVRLYLPQLGINGQEFRITEWAMSAENGVDITLKQETADVWNDAVGKPIERPEITDFPKATVAMPVNLKYDVQEIGQVVQGVLSWGNIGDIAYNTVVIRRAGKVIQTIQVPGQSVNITGLIRGSYQMGVMAVNRFGQRSAEAMIVVEIRAPSKPTGCDVTQEFFAVTLRPRSPDIFTVSTQYDFWTSYEQRLPNAEHDTVVTNATRFTMGMQATSSNLQNDHTYWWYIRAINAFGYSDFLEVEVLCYTDITELMPQIDEAIRDSDAMKNVINGVDTNLEGILQNALANNGTVERQFQQLGEVNAEILTVRTTIATVDSALAQLTTSVKSQFDGVNSQILEQQTAISDNKNAIASLNTYVQAQFGDVTAAINQKLDAEVTNNGTGKASYTLNLGVIRNGVKYNTGFGMSIEPSGGSYKSTIVFAADQFGIYSGSDPGNYQAAFFVYNGQVFMNEAFIRDGSITNAKIGNYIQSNNYVAGASGWLINKAGNAEFNQVTVRGTVYASAGSFTGDVYANNGRFSGVVEAKSFIGDVANMNVWPDVVRSSPGTTTLKMGYTDSSTSNLVKKVMVMCVADYGGRLTININGSEKTYVLSGAACSVMHTAEVSTPTVNASITISSDGTGGRASSPTMIIARGTGRFY